MSLKGIAAVSLALVIGAAAYASEHYRLSTGGGTDPNEMHDEHAAGEERHVIDDEVDVTN